MAVRFTFPSSVYERTPVPVATLTRPQIIELLRFRHEMRRQTFESALRSEAARSLSRTHAAYPSPTSRTDDTSIPNDDHPLRAPHLHVPAPHIDTTAVHHQTPHTHTPPADDAPASTSSTLNTDHGIPTPPYSDLPHDLLFSQAMATTLSAKAPTPATTTALQRPHSPPLSPSPFGDYADEEADAHADADADVSASDSSAADSKAASHTSHGSSTCTRSLHPHYAYICLPHPILSVPARPHRFYPSAPPTPPISIPHVRATARPTPTRRPNIILYETSATPCTTPSMSPPTLTAPPALPDSPPPSPQRGGGGDTGAKTSSRALLLVDRAVTESPQASEDEGSLVGDQGVRNEATRQAELEQRLGRVARDFMPSPPGTPRSAARALPCDGAEDESRVDERAEVVRDGEEEEADSTSANVVGELGVVFCPCDFCGAKAVDPSSDAGSDGVVVSATVGVGGHSTAPPSIPSVSGTAQPTRVIYSPNVVHVDSDADFAMLVADGEGEEEEEGEGYRDGAHAIAHEDPTLDVAPPSPTSVHTTRSSSFERPSTQIVLAPLRPAAAAMPTGHHLAKLGLGWLRGGGNKGAVGKERKTWTMASDDSVGWADYGASSKVAMRLW
ncbi:hypothetical protein HDU93_008308 [Gonapodya sp. JEL0774]|nr:hypothetical protein HDU93_008308 [Gonapodya sp. JEL0774]